MTRSNKKSETKKYISARILELQHKKKKYLSPNLHFFLSIDF